ncbi:UDP-glucose 4-epimerase GalE [Rhodobacterales bacterium HKCCE3408]|nr:UDP-glucose 4-epimerase GalE [Rhodobacterales bacterium HKCCE3408]
MAGQILLTGGAGYIGSHTYVALHAAGFSPVILDDFRNARDAVPERLERITGAPVPVIRADVRDRDALARAFAENDFVAVVHFAALKAVADSMADPVSYYDVNIGGLIALLAEMDAAGCRRLVFSSSATVYGETEENPTPETHPRRAANPYGLTKITCEGMLEHLGPDWAVGILRYFNPAGAHGSGLLGEDARSPSQNLMPVMIEVATGRRERLDIFGDDYDTPDGTAVRDYIHVEDLARGHVLSLRALLEGKGGHIVNLGTGRGYSVREMVEGFSDAIGRPLPHRIAARRPGDVPIYLARTDRAAELLGFRTEKTLAEICDSAWRWSMRNSD